MGFIGDGFKNKDFFLGISIILVLALLIAFSKYIIIGIMLIIGVVLGMSLIGYFGKGMNVLSNKYNKNTDTDAEGGDKS